MRSTILALAAVLTAHVLGATVNVIPLEHDDLTMKFGTLQLRLLSKTGRLPDVHRVELEFAGEQTRDIEHVIDQA